MGFFWFLVSVVLFVVVVSRNKNNNDAYEQGRRDGHQSLADALRTELKSRHPDAARMRAIIAEGVRVDDDEQEGALVRRNEDFMLFAADDEMEFDETGLDESRLLIAPTYELTAEEKAARSLRNLNTILYMASFLLVAAGALFVGAAMPDAVKLFGVWLIVAVFYLAGFTLHLTSERLRPAAVAFLGTGLALIPFAGFALHEYTALGATAAWVMTSVIGLIAYFVAALRLQNQLVSYLTMAFVLSLAGSTTAIASDMLIWQFIVMIGVALVINMMALIKPAWLPSVFREPIEKTGQAVTPLALVASLTVYEHLRLVDYEIVFTAATLHYVVVWLQTRDIIYETAVRILASATLLIVAWDIFAGDWALTGVVVLGLAIVQHGYSLMMVGRAGRADLERNWLAVAFIMQIVSFLLWAGHQHTALFNAIGLIVIGLSSLMVAVRLRSIAVSVIGLVASLLLPFSVLRDLVEPVLPWWVVAMWFMAMAAAALVGYARWRNRSIALRYFMTTAYVLYAGFCLMVAVVDGSAAVLSAALLGLAIFTVVASYVARAAYSQIVAAGLLYAGIIALSRALAIEPIWQFMFVGGVSAAACWMMVAAHGYLRQPVRQMLMLAAGQVSFVTIVGTFITGSGTASKVTVALLLVAAGVSLVLRWWYRQKSPTLSSIFAVSYPVYFAAAVLVASMTSSGWLAVTTGVGVALFLIASYVERSPYTQIISSILTIVTLAIVGTLIHVPSQWQVLFVFGGSAVLFYAATGLHLAYGQSFRQLLMATAAQMTLFLCIFGGYSGDVLVIKTTFVILLVWAVLSLALRWWNRDRSMAFGQLFLASYPTFFIGALLLSSLLTAVWGVLAFIVGSLIFWVASYAERSPTIILVGNVFLAVALVLLWWWMSWSAEWFILGITWVLSALFYFGYWIFAGLNDTIRSRLLIWSTWTLLALGIMANFFNGELKMAVAGTIIALAITLGIDGYRQKYSGLVESAIYIATFGLQRVVALIVPELNFVFYAHWWAVVIGAAALVRRTNRSTCAIVAMGFVTLSSGIYALAFGGWYQILFLTEHLALLVIGAFAARNWAIWWGIAAAAVAILYFLREYTFLWLGFLGLLMIAIVVWRLMRSGAKSE